MEKLNKNLFDLKNQYALITGSCGLLGEQHAAALSLINSNLILVDINKKKGLKLEKKLKKKFDIIDCGSDDNYNFSDDEF